MFDQMINDSGISFTFKDRWGLPIDFIRVFV